jgi:uroporphyrinogen decarboxylase
MKQKEDSKTLGAEHGNAVRRLATGGPLAAVLTGTVLSPPPVWLMRQAGRYLPEYRAVRSEAGSFLELCFDPQKASEVTLQPVDRFGMDAAILFSDILVVPYALGRRVDFVEGDGPRLDPIDGRAIARLDSGLVVERLAPVLETVGLTRARLDPGKSLIGFCGAPWTVATYMVAGRGTSDQAPALEFAASDPDAFQALLDTLVEVSIEYLIAQIRAGADVVQIFDTWAGVLSGDDFERWCVQPTAEIVQGVKANEPEARIIGFPKGIGERIEHYITQTGIDGVSLDAGVALELAKRLQSHVAVQGNLDPALLETGGEAMDDAIDRILAALAPGRFIFNLGHGILPQTPLENVVRLVRRVRGG